MGFLSKLYPHKENENAQKGGGMEDFMTLIRVYYQAAIACKVGITNLNALPDLRVFKQTLHVATVNNKLGQGEKQRCRKMLNEIYGMEDNFFKEIDESIKRNCKQIQDVQTYMLQFQGFSQDLMLLLGNLMKFKLRVPSFFKKAIYSMTQKTVDDIFNKNDFTDPGVVKAVLSVRKYNTRLGFSQQWVADYVSQIVFLAKKEQNKTPEEPAGK